MEKEIKSELLAYFCQKQDLFTVKYHSSQTAQLYEDLYYKIISMPEYATLGEGEQQIIAGGLKRSICLTRGDLINMPSDVPELCRDYSLM